MTLYFIKWPDETFAVVAAESLLDLSIKLDAEGDPSYALITVLTEDSFVTINGVNVEAQADYDELKWKKLKFAKNNRIYLTNA